MQPEEDGSYLRLKKKLEEQFKNLVEKKLREQTALKLFLWVAFWFLVVATIAVALVFAGPFVAAIAGAITILGGLIAFVMVKMISKNKKAPATVEKPLKIAAPKEKKFPSKPKKIETRENILNQGLFKCWEDWRRMVGYAYVGVELLKSIYSPADNWSFQEGEKLENLWIEKLFKNFNHEEQKKMVEYFKLSMSQHGYLHALQNALHDIAIANDFAIPSKDGATRKLTVSVMNKEVHVEEILEIKKYTKISPTTGIAEDVENESLSPLMIAKGEYIISLDEKGIPKCSSVNVTLGSFLDSDLEFSFEEKEVKKKILSFLKDGVDAKVEKFLKLPEQEIPESSPGRHYRRT
jgi:hypothetical protein